MTGEQSFEGMEAPVKKAGSQPWRSEKVRRTQEEARPFLKWIDAHMKIRPELEYHFGGSVRRQAETVGDVDVIIVAEPEQHASVVEFMRTLKGFEVQKGAGAALQGDLTIGSQVMHLDVWLVKPNERGAFLWYVTGPKELNVAMRAAALKVGLSFKQQGLVKLCAFDGLPSDVGHHGQPKIHHCNFGCPDFEQVDTGTELSCAWELQERGAGKWTDWLDPVKRDTWPRASAAPQVKVTPTGNAYADRARPAKVARMVQIIRDRGIGLDEVEFQVAQGAKVAKAYARALGEKGGASLDTWHDVIENLKK